MKSLHYDILIVGAGVAGCATAIALKNSLPGCSICLLDRASTVSVDKVNRQTLPEQTIGETLPAQVVLPMQQLGIWDAFLEMQALRSSGTMAWWGKDVANANESIFSPYGNGWHIDRNQFNQTLLQLALAAGVELLDNTELIDVQASVNASNDTSIWQLELKNSGQSTFTEAEFTDTMAARFIIDATGRKAKLAMRLGAKKQRLDKLVGIYQYYQGSASFKQSIDSTTVVEAMEHGWWYSAALPSGMRVVSLMTDSDCARRYRYRTAKNFHQALLNTHHLKTTIRGLHVESKPRVTAAHTQRLDKLAGPGWLATGDAAFTFDPLSSLGMFKALRMAIISSYAVTDYFSGKDTELAKFQWFANAEFASYLDKKREYYSQESRFKEQQFWQRRRAA